MSKHIKIVLIISAFMLIFLFFSLDKEEHYELIKFSLDKNNDIKDILERISKRNYFVLIEESLTETRLDLEKNITRYSKAELFHLLDDIVYYEFILGQYSEGISSLKRAIWELPNVINIENLDPEGIKEHEDHLYANLSYAEADKNKPSDCEANLERLDSPHIREVEDDEELGIIKGIDILYSFLSDDRDNKKSLWALNILKNRLGERGSLKEDSLYIDYKKDDENIDKFENIAEKSGISIRNFGGGTIIDDFNNDGFLDLIISSSAMIDPLHYFKNNGDGTFSNNTKSSNLDRLLGGMIVYQADYNNDGYLDFYITRGGSFGKRGKYSPNSLIKNNGDGTFSDVTFISGLGDVHYPSASAGWSDFDNDGDLDLYVANSSKFGFDNSINIRYSHDIPPRHINEMYPSQLFENNGDGTFTDIPEDAGVSNMRNAMGVSWGDYNNDGYPDLYVSNMGFYNRLYRNNGDGKFTDVAEELRVEKPVFSFPTWFWDLNNDGYLDLYVAPHEGDINSAVEGFLKGDFKEKHGLYINRGGQKFENEAISYSLNHYWSTFGGNFGDIDNDGYLDFYLGNGSTLQFLQIPDVFYKNKGGEYFNDVSNSGGFNYLSGGYGISFGDIDNDGDQDVVHSLSGPWTNEESCNVLLQNPGTDNNWITITLEGTISNRSAIGARIRLDITENGKERSIYRTVGTGGSFGANSLQQEIGIGKANMIDKIEIFWPTSKTTQTFTKVRPNQFIKVLEESDKYTKEDRKKVVF